MDLMVFFSQNYAKTHKICFCMLCFCGIWNKGFDKWIWFQFVFVFLFKLDSAAQNTGEGWLILIHLNAFEILQAFSWRVTETEQQQVGCRWGWQVCEPVLPQRSSHLKQMGISIHNFVAGNNYWENETIKIGKQQFLCSLIPNYTTFCSISWSETW